MIKIGILGAAGYTGGELIRLLINHPEAEIVFANSESNAGNLVADVHEGLLGETQLKFTDQLPFDKVDVVFFCFGHGKSEAFMKEHDIPANVKIIDLAQDFRLHPQMACRHQCLCLVLCFQCFLRLPGILVDHGSSYRIDAVGVCRWISKCNHGNHHHHE